MMHSTMRSATLSAVVAIAALSACTPQEEIVVFDMPLNAASSAAVSSSRATVVASKAASVSPSSSAPASVAVQPASVALITPKPARVQISVPFATQAPLGNWDMPYQEACEEASLILVQYYFDKQPITPALMDKEILDVVAWQERNGMDADIDAAEMKRTAEEYFGKTAEVRYDGEVTIASIEAELAKGNPVILPLAGRDIGNPYFSGEGPWYHVLVVTGYDGTFFTTNDVGTKRGESYKYRKQVLFDAIHDWTGVKEEIRQGRKAMVVLSIKG